MKRLLSALIVVSVFVATSAFAEMYVGKVDVQRVLLTVDQTKSVRAQLMKEFGINQASLSKEEDEIRKMQDDYNEKSRVMTEQEKAAKEGELQERFAALQRLTQQYQDEMKDMEQKFKTPMLAKIRDIVIEVSKTAGVDATFESESTAMLYAKQEKDLTEEVITLYNAQNPQQ